ncbi:MAG: cupin domain-containing protein [Chloroflexota bacterium]|nr:cupin domain-containing protein [Chloroflexota bacterium]MDQ5864153.1 cupin domain-containing protein [Chloroflexota bacterium]
MLLVDVNDCPEFVAGDETLLREVLHPSVHGAPIRYSIAHALLRPGGRSLPHRLVGSEVYYILQGHGRIYIDDESSEVRAGQVVYVPPGATQFVENGGSSDLVFLCIVDPAWSAADEAVDEVSPTRRDES